MVVMPSLRRLSIVVVTAIAALFAILAPASPARAHTVGGVGATNFRTILSAVSPAVAGVSLKVIENGSRLELRNDTSGDVVVAGYTGEPYVRVGPSGVFLNNHSPATYLNADRLSRTPVPADADSTAAPDWRQVADEPVWRWHDHRVHWMLPTLPPSVAANPDAPHRISSWTVVLDYGGERLTATGSLDWVPGPSPLVWFVLLVVVALGVVATVVLRRPHRLLAVATVALLALDVVHRTGVMLVSHATVPERLSVLFGSEALLVWPFATVGVWLLWRGHTRAGWLSAMAGLLTIVALAVDDLPVLWRSSAPTVLPETVNRWTVAVTLGLGIGLVLVLPVLLLRHPIRGRAARRPAMPAPVSDVAHTGSPDAQVLAYGRDGQPAGGGLGRRQVTGYLAVGALGAVTGAAAGLAASGYRPAAGPTGPATPAGLPSGSPAGNPGAGGSAGPEVLLADVGARTVAFHGERQAGIATPARPQARVWLAGFDLVAEADAQDLRDLLRRWTGAAAKLTAGLPLGETDDTVTAGLGPAALTITVGFGHSLFGKAGVPVSARPEALDPLPTLGDRLDPHRSDGDLGVVVAGDDEVVVTHTARVLQRLAVGVASLRWQMSGFNAARGAGSDLATPRNLMGQVDGTNNPQPSDPDFDTRVFVDPQASPEWLLGGSYLVFRRVRMLLDAWDHVPVAEQERVIGRRKDNGAPLSGGAERAAPNFDIVDADGAPVIPINAHIRLAAPAFNQGAAMLRRGFSYVDGADSGLLFLAWQADPRRGFLPVQQRLSEADALSRFIRHEAGAMFAMPGGTGPDGYLGQRLLEYL